MKRAYLAKESIQAIRVYFDGIWNQTVAVRINN
jgi:hypothetical protein